MMERLDSSPCTENQLHVFCVKDTLQFFNSRDVTLIICGYDRRDRHLTILEKKLLSIVRVELENVLSSLLLACHPHTISNCKSFASFLLRIISVSSDVACVNTCYETLEMILTTHPHAKSISISSSDIFMMLFNYGIDTKHCHLLKYLPDIDKRLYGPTCQGKSYNKIPKNWAYNVKVILKTLITLVSACDMESKDLNNMIIFLLWMSFDPLVHKENMYSILQDCISACVEQIMENDYLIDIAKTLVLTEFPDSSEKWRAVYNMAESVPNSSKKCNYLRQNISFLVLNHLCYGTIKNIDSLKFSIKEFTELVQEITNIKSEVLSSLAAKYVDLCADMNTSDKISSLKKSCKYTKCKIKLEERAKYIQPKVENSVLGLVKIKTEKDSSLIDIKSKMKQTVIDPVDIPKLEWSEKVSEQNSVSTDEKITLISEHPDPTLRSKVESQTKDVHSYDILHTIVKKEFPSHSISEVSQSGTEILSDIVKEEFSSCSINDSIFKTCDNVNFSDNIVDLNTKSNELNLCSDFSQNIQTIQSDQTSACSTVSIENEAHASDTVCQILLTDSHVYPDENCNFPSEDLNDPISAVKIVAVESFADTPSDMDNLFEDITLRKSLPESKFTSIHQNILNGSLSQNSEDQLFNTDSLNLSKSVSDVALLDGSVVDFPSKEESGCLVLEINQTLENAHNDKNLGYWSEEHSSKPPDRNSASAKRKGMSDFSNMSLKFQRTLSADDKNSFRRKLGEIVTGSSMSHYQSIPTESKENIISVIPEVKDTKINDPDIQLLYTDSRNYADQDCIITYESKSCIVLD